MVSAQLNQVSERVSRITYLGYNHFSFSNFEKISNFKG